MILALAIDRSDANNATVKCFLDGSLTSNFYGFAQSYTDAEIENYVRGDLIAKGYGIS